MDQAAWQRTWDRRHEKRPFHDGTFKHWAEKASDDFPYHYNDGVTIMVGDTDDESWDRLIPDETDGPVVD